MECMRHSPYRPRSGRIEPKTKINVKREQWQISRTVSREVNSIPSGARDAPSILISRSFDVEKMKLRASTTLDHLDLSSRRKYILKVYISLCLNKQQLAPLDRNSHDRDISSEISCQVRNRERLA